MPDFTSALYLGLHHAAPALHPWSQLTTGRPAALGVPAATTRVAAGLARLTGQQGGVLSRSTLHAFVDVGAALVTPDDGLLFDAGAYPISGWALADRTGASARFAHHDPGDLAALLAREPFRRLRPVVVCDGWCPGCGRAAPIAAYLDLLRPRRGTLVLDDTQALGVLGANPSPAQPYGQGGGGSLAWSGVTGPARGDELVVVSSLAKGFGVPVAVTVGGEWPVRRIRSGGPTQTHSSPPSAADVNAARHALASNVVHGERLRARLVRLVRRLRWQVRRLGLRLRGGLFPVQSLTAVDEGWARRLERALTGRGVRAVLQQPRCRPGSDLTLLVTARHRSDEIDRAAVLLGDALAEVGRRALFPQGGRDAISS